MSTIHQEKFEEGRGDIDIRWRSECLHYTRDVKDGSDEHLGRHRRQQQPSAWPNQRTPTFDVHSQTSDCEIVDQQCVLILYERLRSPLCP